MKIENPSSIAVFRALQLGDLICSVPALRALRRAFPQSRVTLIGLPWARDFAARFKTYIDDFIAFPGYPGLPEITPDINAIPQFFKTAQDRHFDLAIQLHGSGSFVNPITVLLGAKKNAGFYLPTEYCPDLNLFLPYPETGSEIDRLLKLLEFLGIPLQGRELEFPILDKARDELARFKAAHDLGSHPYVCIHPGARFKSRRWLPERFATVGDALARQGLRVVITGSKDELELACQVERLMRYHALNLAGCTTLDSLALILKEARLLVCNDTGVSHIASALNVPSVVVVAGSDPDRWAPLDPTLHRVVMEPVYCRPCTHVTCPIGHPCAVKVEPDKVIQESKHQLKLETANPVELPMNS